MPLGLATEAGVWDGWGPWIGGDREPGEQLKTKLVDAAAYAFVRSLVAVIQVLPLDMGDAVCRVLATLLSRGVSIRRRATQENFDRIFPGATERQKDRLRSEMWHSLLLTACEVAWASRRLHRCNWPLHVQFENNRAMLANLLSPRASVVVTGHYGNFEIGGYVTGLMGFETLAIARRLDNPYLHRWVERFRGAKGQFLIDKDGCADAVNRHLAGGGTLSMLADQHAGDKGCWTHFMGVPASCHKALALFSFAADAPMFVAMTRRIGRRPMQFSIEVAGRVDPSDAADPASADVTAMTDWYNRSMAAGVARDVTQYWWLHRRWRAVPARAAKRLARRMGGDSAATATREDRQQAA